MHLARPKGQALTEFLLIIPLFFVLLLGVLQFSLLSLAYQAVHYASFAACRAAIVRPCAAFNPDDDSEEHFAPEVFAAATLANMAVAPSQQLFPAMPYSWMPLLPNTQVLVDLNFGAVDDQISQYKYVNSAYLTGVMRVEPDYGQTPTVWTPYDPGPGPGEPCMDDDGLEIDPEQNVPSTGHDISLEVTMIYPMNVPLVNRVFYGVFVNYSDIAADLLLSQMPETDEKQVMTYPTAVIPGHTEYSSNVSQTISTILSTFGFSAESASAGIASVFGESAWYPLPIRARTTLTVEGSVVPMINYTSPFPGDHD